MNGICPKCKEHKTLTVYHHWPKQWYHGSGPVTCLCHECQRRLDVDYPLTQVLTTKECDERVKFFLGNHPLHDARHFSDIN